MGAIHGKRAVVLIDGHDISDYFREATATQAISADDTTTFNQEDRTFTVGIGDGKLSLGGLFDANDVPLADERLAAALDAESSTLMYGLGGNARGNRCRLASAVTGSYEVSEKVTDVAETKAEFQVSDTFDNGVILAAARSVATATTTNETSVDHGAESTNGGIAQLHVTANDHDDDLDVIVQHSSNNSAWSDLATFTTVAAEDIESQRVVLAAGTTINRYVRAISTTAGTGVVVYTVALARR